MLYILKLYIFFIYKQPTLNTMRLQLSWSTTKVFIVCVVCLVFKLLLRRLKLNTISVDSVTGLKGRPISILTTSSTCDDLLEKLMGEEKINKNTPIGLDCEWGEKKVSLIQICSANHTAIIQLDKFKNFPIAIKTILESRNFLKMGAAIRGDAKRLLQDWGIHMGNWLCLQHVCTVYNLSPEGISLQKMSLSLCGITLYKGNDIRLTNWDAPTLSKPQVIYAGNDAIASYAVGIELVKIKGHDRVFSHKNQSSKRKNVPETNSLKNPKPQKIKKFSDTTKKIYDNVMLLSNDGCPLVCCDQKKANWYLKKKLATVITTSPFVIKLLFEPVGKNTVAEAIQNVCVVCGVDADEKGLLKHHVVPSCFRQKFPDHKKSHQPHDIVLSCKECSIQCQHYYDIYKKGIYKEFNVVARLSPSEQHIRSCASAIACTRLTKQSMTDIVTYNTNSSETVRCKNIPKIRFDKLRQIVSTELSIIPSELCYSHVQNVITKYTLEPTSSQVVSAILSKDGESGLDDFIKGWREIFIKAMEPKHLPKSWSINHIFIDERRKAGYVPPYLRSPEAPTL